MYVCFVKDVLSCWGCIAGIVGMLSASDHKFKLLHASSDFRICAWVPCRNSKDHAAVNTAPATSASASANIVHRFLDKNDNGGGAHNLN